MIPVFLCDINKGYEKVRVVNKKNLSTMIVGVVTIAIAVVCVFLYVSRPTEIDKLSQSYLDTVDVEKLQKRWRQVLMGLIDSVII